MDDVIRTGYGVFKWILTEDRLCVDLLVKRWHEAGGTLTLGSPWGDGSVQDNSVLVVTLGYIITETNGNGLCVFFTFKFGSIEVHFSTPFYVCGSLSWADASSCVVLNRPGGGGERLDCFHDPSVPLAFCSQPACPPRRLWQP